MVRGMHFPPNTKANGAKNNYAFLYRIDYQYIIFSIIKDTLTIHI
jgi:hypothetical protein